MTVPVRSILNGKDIHSFDYTSSEWQHLKATYKTNQLITACCGRPAIPKTSQLGSYFFAHKIRGDCSSAPETKEHLLAKIQIATAAKALGWQVTTELRGETPEGEVWIADVVAWKGESRIAFEVQWSSQSPDVTRTRQERYRKSGLRCIWFKQLTVHGAQNKKLLEEQSTPEFGIYFLEKAQTFEVPRFKVNLKEFVLRILRGELSWELPDGTKVVAHLLIKNLQCFFCLHRVNAAVGLELFTNEGLSHSVLRATGASGSRVDKIIKYLLRDHKTQNELTIGGFTYSILRDGDTPKFVNRCFRCNHPLSWSAVKYSPTATLISDTRITLTLGHDVPNDHGAWFLGGNRGLRVY